MASNPIRPRAVLAVILLAVFAAMPLRAADVYDAAVHNSHRPAADIKRDATDRPAEVLRFAGVKPGMHVLDFLAADGYYSELLSYVVGPTGQVVMLNNKPYDDFSPGRRKRVANDRLPNVEHRTAEFADLGLAPNSFDAIVLVKVYHDLYWVSPQDGWPKVNVASVLDQLQRALKPGGMLLLVDHSAKLGTGNKVAGSLHRIDESYARKQYELHGLEFVRESNALRNPADSRDQISFKPPMLGHTDRFMLLFRKPAQ